MGFFKKIFKPFKSVVDTAIDAVTDTGKAIVNIVTGAFTGGFGVPDINIPDTTSDINESLTINYNASNSAIPVIYGRKVDTTVIPVHVKTHGPKNEFLTVIGAISTGVAQTHSTGAWIWGIEIDNEMVGRMYPAPAATSSEYSQFITNGYNFDNSNFPDGDEYNAGVTGWNGLQLAAHRKNDGQFPLATGFNGDQPPCYAPSLGRFAARFKCQFFSGGDNQPVSELARIADPEWNERLPGIMYGVFQFHLFNESYGDYYKVQYKNSYGGLPQIKLTVEGRNVPDIVTRDNNPDTPATGQWDTVFANGYKHDGVHDAYQAGFSPTMNPVCHLLDYMLNPYYGAGIPLDKFDKDSWVRAAKVPRYFKNYNTTTSLFGLGGFLYKLIEGFIKPGGEYLEQIDGTIYNMKRDFFRPSDTDTQTYEPFNSGGTVPFVNNPYNRQFKIYPDRSYLENINLMLRSMGAILTYSGGKYKILMENAGNEENSFDIPTVATLKSQCDAANRTFTDDNISGSISIKGAALENTFNQVKVNYPDFENKSKSNSEVYPDDNSALLATYLQEDNNQKLTAEITNTGIYNKLDALMYAKVTLNKSRNRETLTFVTNDSASNITAGDIIRVNSSLAGIDNLYRVTDFLITDSGQIEISGIRHIPDNYDFEVDSFADKIRKIFRERQPVVQRPVVTIKAPEQLTIDKVKREDDFFDLSLNTTDIILRWVDRNVTASTNTYEISIEAVAQNNQTFGTRILGESATAEFKIKAEELPPGATIVFGVRTKTPNGNFSQKTLVTGNNTPSYNTPLNNSVVPFENEWWQNIGTLSSGGTPTAGQQVDAGNTGEGEL